MDGFAGAVLTGGRSTRLGSDKALAELGGVPMAAIAARALRGAGASAVLAIGGDGKRLAAWGLAPVPDDHPGDGPLGAILTAIRAAAGAPVFVLSCDLPRCDAAGVRAVVDRAPARADVAVPVLGGRLEPLHALYRPSAYAALDAAFRAGERSPSRAVRSCRLALVDEGLDPRALEGADTPAALAAARRWHTGPVQEPGIPEIDVGTLARLREQGAFVLDVRQPDEYESGHVPGAVLVPLDQLGGRIGEVPQEEPVYVICRTGARSAVATQVLIGAGYRASNVAGGTEAWIAGGHELAHGPAAG